MTRWAEVITISWHVWRRILAHPKLRAERHRLGRVQGSVERFVCDTAGALLIATCLIVGGLFTSHADGLVAATSLAVAVVCGVFIAVVARYTKVAYVPVQYALFAVVALIAARNAFADHEWFNRFVLFGAVVGGIWLGGIRADLEEWLGFWVKHAEEKFDVDLLDGLTA